MQNDTVMQENDSQSKVNSANVAPEGESTHHGGATSPDETTKEVEGNNKERRTSKRQAETKEQIQKKKKEDKKKEDAKIQAEELKKLEQARAQLNEERRQIEATKRDLATKLEEAKIRNQEEKKKRDEQIDPIEEIDIGDEENEEKEEDAENITQSTKLRLTSKKGKKIGRTDLMIWYADYDVLPNSIEQPSDDAIIFRIRNSRKVQNTKKSTAQNYTLEEIQEEDEEHQPHTPFEEAWKIYIGEVKQENEGELKEAIKTTAKEAGAKIAQIIPLHNKEGLYITLPSIQDYHKLLSRQRIVLKKAKIVKVMQEAYTQPNKEYIKYFVGAFNENIPDPHTVRASMELATGTPVAAVFCPLETNLIPKRWVFAYVPLDAESIFSNPNKKWMICGQSDLIRRTCKAFNSQNKDDKKEKKTNTDKNKGNQDKQDDQKGKKSVSWSDQESSSSGTDERVKGKKKNKKKGKNKHQAKKKHNDSDDSEDSDSDADKERDLFKKFLQFQRKNKKK